MKWSLNQSKLQQEIRALSLELSLSANQYMPQPRHWSLSVSEERPLIPGTLRGYREWYFPNGILTPLAVTMRGGWKPGWNQAHCQRDEFHSFPTRLGDHFDEQVPVRDCGCGFWGTYKYQTQFYGHYFKPQIIEGVVGGVIEAAGRITLHRTGFRAERAQVKALFPIGPTVFGGLLHEVADLYQVPLLQGQQEAEKQFPPVDPVTLGIPPEKPLLDREQHKWHTHFSVKDFSGRTLWSGTGLGSVLATGD